MNEECDVCSGCYADVGPLATLTITNYGDNPPESWSLCHSCLEEIKPARVYPYTDAAGITYADDYEYEMSHLTQM